MLRTLLEAAGFAWLAYNAWRVLASQGHAIEVSAEVTAECPRASCFSTYMKIKEYYLQLSPGHRKYEMSEGSPLKDALIQVWETAGFQFVKHRYRVAELVPNERMALVSERSEVKILGLLRSASRSEVEFRFSDAQEGKTLLGLTIRIVFPNRLRHFLARLMFTEQIWRSHAREEMAALARVMELRGAIGGN